MTLFQHMLVLDPDALAPGVRDALRVAYALAQARSEHGGARPITRSDLLRALLLDDTLPGDTLAELGVAPERVAAWREAARR